MRSRRTAWAAAGIGSVLLALSPPVHHRADHSVAWHMLQHLILMLMAAPMLAFARALTGVLHALSRHGWRRLATSGPVRLLARAPVGMSFAAQAIVMWGWHVPAFFNLAATGAGWHAAQHASFLATGLWFWESVRRGFSPQPGPGTGRALLSLFGTATHSAVLGALVVFLPDRVYMVHAAGAPVLAEHADQQLAGLLMWVPAGVAYLIAGVLLAMRLAGPATSVTPPRPLTSASPSGAAPR